MSTSLLCSLLAGSVAALPVDRAAAGLIDPQPPSVLLIVADDLAWGDLGSYGGTAIRTPNLDRLASEGLRFTRFYGQPTCSPSRVALFTGRHPTSLGYRAPVFLSSRRRLPPEVPVLPEMLPLHRPRSALLGKWHLGRFSPESAPLRRGFAHTVEHNTRLAPFESYFDPRLTVDADQVVQESGHLTKILTDRALAFLARQDGAPFLLALTYFAPHDPAQPPAEWAAQYPDDAAGRYAALVSHLDEQVGRLLDGLQQLGLAEDTLVLFVSDNGGTTAFHPDGIADLRGFKFRVLEGGVRVPALARWPGRVPAGAVDDVPRSMTDVVPTLLELCGAPVPRTRLDGESFAGVLRGEPARPRRAPIVFEQRLGAPAARDAGVVRRHALIWRGRKLVLDRFRDAPALYDVDADRGEAQDLALLEPERMAELSARYVQLRRSATRVPLAVQRVSDPTAVLGGLGQLVFVRPGLVELVPSSRLDVHDGEFSLTARVTVLGDAAAVLAERPGSWCLELASGGFPRLTLVDHDSGLEVSLRSSVALTPGLATRLAFTHVGHRNGDALTRLYVEGREVARSRGRLDALRVVDAPVSLGGAADGSRPFRGVLADLSLHVACLDPVELPRSSVVGADAQESDGRRSTFARIP